MLNFILKINCACSWGTTTCLQLRSNYGVSTEYLYSKLGKNELNKAVMAKIYSDGKIPKRLGDYVVYSLHGENVMRRKSGFTSVGMRKDAKLEKSRNNATEFGKVSSLCKKMRVALIGILSRKNNLAVCNSLVKMMRQLLSFDIESPLGERNLQKAFENENARMAFYGYNFNPDCLLASVLLVPFSFDSLNHSLLLASFKKEKLIVFPNGANNAGFRLHCLCFDFGTGESSLSSSDWAFSGSGSKVTSFSVATVPSLLSASNSLLFYILELQFFVFDTGSYVPMADDRSKAVCVVGSMVC